MITGLTQGIIGGLDGWRLMENLNSCLSWTTNLCQEQAVKTWLKDLNQHLNIPTQISTLDNNVFGLG
jgi:hypothetical protein